MPKIRGTNRVWRTLVTCLRAKSVVRDTDLGRALSLLSRTFTASDLGVVEELPCNLIALFLPFGPSLTSAPRTFNLYGYDTACKLHPTEPVHTHVPAPRPLKIGIMNNLPYYRITHAKIPDL